MSMEEKSTTPQIFLDAYSNFVRDARAMQFRQMVQMVQNTPEKPFLGLKKPFFGSNGVYFHCWEGR